MVHLLFNVACDNLTGVAIGFAELAVCSSGNHWQICTLTHASLV